MIWRVALVIGFWAAGIAAAEAPDNSAKTADRTQEPIGRWLTESGNLEVDLAPCGDGLCGTVARVISDRSMSGAKPAAAPADAPALLGLKILKDFVPSGKNEWKGQIYNRDEGKNYDCVMTFVPPDQLNVRGYKMIPLFGKTQVWRRVATP